MKRILPLTALVAGASLLAGTVAYASTRDPAPAVASSPVSSVVPAGDAASATAAHADDHAAMPDTDMGGMDMGDMDMGGMDHGDGHGHMEMTLPPLSARQREATAEQRAAADQFWADTKAAVAPYENIDNARAAGFVQNKSQADATVIHYPQPANRKDDRQLDPSHPEGLVYRHNPDGTYSLMGAVYTVAAGEPAPTPGGPIFQWHTHQDCPTFYVPPGGCADTFRMLHVWTAPGVVDPFTNPFRAAFTNA